MAQQLPAFRGTIILVIAGAVVLVVGLVVWNRDQTDRGLADERVRAAEARAAAAEARANAASGPTKTGPKLRLYMHPDGTLSKEPPTESQKSVILKEEELPPQVDLDDVVVAPVNDIVVVSVTMPEDVRKKAGLTSAQARKYKWAFERIDRQQNVMCYPNANRNSPKKFLAGTPVRQDMAVIGFESLSGTPAEIKFYWLSPQEAAALAQGSK